MQQPAGWPRERVAHLKMPSPVAVAGPCDGPQALSLRHLVQRIGHGSKPRHGFGAIGQRGHPVGEVVHRPSVEEHARGRRSGDDGEHYEVFGFRYWIAPMRGATYRS